MFGFGKKGKMELSKKIGELSNNGTEQILYYLKEDSIIYGKCINDNPIKNTTNLFLIHLYDDMLCTKYNKEDVFTVIFSLISSFANDEPTRDWIRMAYLENAKQCKNAVNYYKNLSDFEIAEALTITFLGLIIDDKEFLMNELETTIVNSNCYRKIYNYIDGVIKNRTLLNEEYKMRLK